MPKADGSTGASRPQPGAAPDIGSSHRPEPNAAADRKPGRKPAGNRQLQSCRRPDKQSTQDRALAPRHRNRATCCGSGGPRASNRRNGSAAPISAQRARGAAAATSSPPPPAGSEWFEQLDRVVTDPQDMLLGPLSPQSPSSWPGCSRGFCHAPGIDEQRGAGPRRWARPEGGYVRKLPGSRRGSACCPRRCP